MAYINKLREELPRIVVYALLGFAVRIFSDALHLPGYYDSLGALAASASRPLNGLIAAVITGAFLYPYYQVYLLGWIPAALASVGFAYLRRRGTPILGAAFASILYVFGWDVVYCFITGTWRMFRSYLATRGALILMLDVYACSTVAEALNLNIWGKLTGKKLLAIGLLSVALGASSWASVRGNEWSVTGSFPEHKGWLKFHSKMDIVWIWMGGKGINNYYYPEDRFTKGSIGYQVWVGMYWVQGWNDVRDVALVSRFAVWDQNFWNSVHGVKAPYTYVDNVLNITEIEFWGHKAYLMYGGMVTQSDVKPYEEVELQGFFITFYDEDKDRTAIIYACSIREVFPEAKDTLWRLVNSWRPQGG